MVVDTSGTVEPFVPTTRQDFESAINSGKLTLNENGFEDLEAELDSAFDLDEERRRSIWNEAVRFGQVSQGEASDLQLSLYELLNRPTEPNTELAKTIRGGLESGLHGSALSKKIKGMLAGRASVVSSGKNPSDILPFPRFFGALVESMA